MILDDMDIECAYFAEQIEEREQCIEELNISPIEKEQTFSAMEIDLDLVVECPNVSSV